MTEDDRRGGDRQTTYRVEPARVSSNRSRPILTLATIAAVASAAVLVGLAIWPSSTPLEQVARSTAAAPATASDVAAAPSPAPRLTASVECHGVVLRRCHELARAALTVVDPEDRPQVTGIDVWSSIACGSDFDCPAYRFDGRRPAGSAILTYDSAAEELVDITEGVGGPGRSWLPSTTDFEAWVIRYEST